MDTLLTVYLLLMAASHAGGVVLAARKCNHLSACINGALFTTATILLLERL